MKVHPSWQRFHARNAWLWLGVVLALLSVWAVYSLQRGRPSQTPKSAEQMAREGNSPIPWSDMEDAEQILLENVRVEMTTDQNGKTIPIVAFDLSNESEVHLSSISLGFENVASNLVPAETTGDGFIGLNPPIAPGESKTLRSRAWSKQRDYGFPITREEIMKGNSLRMHVTHIVGERSGKGVVFRNLDVLTTLVGLDAYQRMSSTAR